MKHSLSTLVGVSLSMLSGLASADVVFSPFQAGPSAAGTGANASFYAIDPAWQGSTVAWNESTRQYGTDLSAPGFAPIGSFGWGTGIWGKADWNAITAPSSTVPITSSFSSVLPSIAFADTCYLQNATLGSGSLPLLAFPSGASACPGAAGPVVGNHDNWASKFTGFIRVTDPGTYNFSVGSDDGFFLDLFGAGGSKISMNRDFLNGRGRESFADNLILSEGLYQFELGAWDRLEAGFVDLRWKLPGASDFTLIPAQNLLSSAGTGGTVSLPGTLALGAAAGLFGWAARRRRPAS